MLLYFLIFFQFILLVIALGLVIYIGLVMASFKNPVPYVPTSKSVIKKMIKVANIQSGDKVVDLGSGTGRIVFAIAKKYSVKIIGIEKSCLLYSISNLRLIFKRKKDRVEFVRTNFQDYPFSDAKVVFCFLTPEGIQTIQKKIEEELPKGAKLVSYLFPLKKNQQFEESKVTVKVGKDKDYIFVYKKKGGEKMAEEKEIGKITHYFGKISVGIIELTDSLKVGDKIHIKGNSTDFEQEVGSIQIEHEDVQEGKKGDSVGIKVDQTVKEGDTVSLIME